MEEKIMKKVGAILFGGFLFFLWLVTSSPAQDYPSRPIEFNVTWPPGGISDVQARALCKIVEKSLGQSMVVVNKPGANGAVGLAYLASQKADGYTLSLFTSSSAILFPFFEKATYKTDDFSYIMGINYNLQVLSVKSDAPWNTFREFLDYAKKNPGKVKYATFSAINAISISMDLIAQEEGIDWTHVPYKGDGPAITAMLGGHVDALATTSAQLPYVRSGTLKLLAIFNSHRSHSFPNVPTLKALGYKFPMLSDMTTSTGVIGPKGIKTEILQKLEDTFTQAAKDPSYVRLLESLDCPIAYKSGKEFEKEILGSYQVCERLLPPIAAKMKK
jgi:tripartite-type tricarboxylate transporter receptor subunit TctC